MFYEEDTPRGRISYHKSLVGSIVRAAVREVAGGRAIPSDSKGRPLKQPRATANAQPVDDFVDAEMEGGKMNVTCRIIVRFGTSLRGMVELLDEAVRRALPASTGTEVARVRIVVTGMKSKNITRRNLTYCSEWDASAGRAVGAWQRGEHL